MKVCGLNHGQRDFHAHPRAEERDGLQRLLLKFSNKVHKSTVNIMDFVRYERKTPMPCSTFYVI